jgi:short subunit dehydrogenase-like uncharacterized protein
VDKICGNWPHGPEVATAYGVRRTCTECGHRWTKINGEVEWVEERYTSMHDNVTEEGYGGDSQGVAEPARS